MFFAVVAKHRHDSLVYFSLWLVYNATKLSSWRQWEYNLYMAACGDYHDRDCSHYHTRYSGHCVEESDQEKYVSTSHVLYHVHVCVCVYVCVCMCVCVSDNNQKELEETVDAKGTDNRPNRSQSSHTEDMADILEVSLLHWNRIVMDFVMINFIGTF